MADTRLEGDLDDVLWNLVNIFHRKIVNLDRALDDNEQAQHRISARTGWLRGQIRRTGANDRAGHLDHRAS